MPPSVHSSNILLHNLSRSVVKLLRWLSPLPTPNLHSEVVTQHGSGWVTTQQTGSITMVLVMEPVSHPANINLNPHPLVQLEPPSSGWRNSHKTALGEWASGGKGCDWRRWAGSQIRTIFYAQFILPARNTHGCKHTQMHKRTQRFTHGSVTQLVFQPWQICRTSWIL